MRVPSVPRCPDSDRTTAVVRSALLLQPVPVTHYSLVMARLTDKTGLLREELHSFIHVLICQCVKYLLWLPAHQSIIVIGESSFTSHAWEIFYSLIFITLSSSYSSDFFCDCCNNISRFEIINLVSGSSRRVSAHAAAL